jgi:proline-rich protein PRCC
MLVAYSDSEDEDQEPASAPAPPPPTQPSAPAEPPAKKARKEINLQALLQKHDVALPFEAASKLPADFFDSGPAREADAGELKERVSGTSGWAALSSLLPPPKNTSKVSKASTLYANAKPLNRGTAKAASRPSAGAAASSEPAGPSVVGSVGPSPSAAVGSCSAVGDETSAPLGGELFGSQDADEADPGVGTGQVSALRPRVVTDMYGESSPQPATAAGPQQPVALGLGPELGPAMGPSLPGDGTAGYAELGYPEAGMGYPDLSEGKVVDVSQADLRKALGAAKQYEFTPAPKQEVAIAASFWSRKTGTVESQYQASSLQKRKHQINSLAADAAQQAAVIAANGAKTNKSKAQTAAKYGW